MKNEEKIINIEYGINGNNNNFIYTSNNVQPIFKLDFNFDILIIYILFIRKIKIIKIKLVK